MRPTTLYIPALVLATSTLAVPTGVEHDFVRAERTVQSTLRSAWNSLVSSTFGWYDLPTVFEDTLAHIEGVLDEPQKSVWQTLKADDKFSNLTRLIEHDKEIKKILDGASHGLTFFAPDNKALKPPRRRKDILDVHASHDDVLSHLAAYADELDGGDDKDDDDKERKRRIFKKILHAVLSYHILPLNIGAVDIGLNSTVATNLIPEDGSADGQARRIKVEHTVVPPTVLLNKYVKVTKGDIYATNGIIHSIDHPLLPPPSILDIAFLGPQKLSTFTSAVQKVGLQDALQWKYVHSKKDAVGALDFEGSPTVTAFVPTNAAFEALPERLLLFLFSPFGERALRKLLQYHIVPDFIVHTEWIYNAKEKKDAFSAMGTELEFEFPFPTALKNTTLPVYIKKTTPTIPVPGVAFWEFKVQGTKLLGAEYDIPARNGALHIVNKILNPYADDDNVAAWDNWEEWLPAWANEN